MGWKINMESKIQKVKSDVEMMSNAMKDIIKKISIMEDTATTKKQVDLHTEPKKKAKKDVDSSKDKKQD
jgi:hypothetical protein